MSSIQNFSTRHLLQSLLLLGCLLAAVPARSQTAPQCFVTCSPDPTSSTYTGGTFAARWALWNLRRGGPFSPPIRPHGGGGGHAHGNTGASTYDYAIPVLSLPGRNGLDVNLTLFYSSRVWILDTVNNRMTFNADRDFPSHGFRLGYGYIERSGSSSAPSILLTEPDGTKRQLQLVSGSTTIFTTVDSTYITWDNTNLILTRKNGERWFYAPTPTSTSMILAPIKIEDTNGNFISITYQTAAGFDTLSIYTITDTAGRVVTFNYNTSKELTSISVTTPGISGAKTQATLAGRRFP